MHGTIYFTEIADLAEFLAEFTGKSTAVFEVVPKGTGFVLTFTGGF